jgi:hypothetical protein
MVCELRNGQENSVSLKTRDLGKPDKECPFATLSTRTEKTPIKQSATCYLLHTGFLPGLFFDP